MSSKRKRPPRAPEQLGDAPVEPRYRDLLPELARSIDEVLNLGKPKKETGFVLMLFPFDDHGGHCNMTTNATAEDVKLLFKEQHARFEGRVARDGTA